MHNLDYLLARSGEASKWRVELVEVLSSLTTGGFQNRIGDLLYSTVIGGPGSVLMGSQAMEEFLRDTQFERIPHRLPGTIVKAVATAGGHTAAIRDRVPGINWVRRVTYGRLIPNPSLLINPVFDVLEKLHKVSSTYTMHDTNTSGHAFAS
jgi:hypothetical protein